MTARRRRRLMREETVAPLLTVLVILTLWWVGASLIGAGGDPPDASASYPVAPGEAAAPDRARPGAAGMPGVPATTRDVSVDSDASVALGPAAAGSRDTVDPAIAGDMGNRSGRGDGAVVPVAGIAAGDLKSTFNEARGGGSRRHEAMDILAPRGTPVLAAVDGRVVKLFTSAAGGLTIYQFDEDERYCYYYAHLDAYAAELTEGQKITRGQLIGYVGTTGNAAPDTPHLHFAIFKLGPEKKWWEGEALDPIDFLR